MATLNLAEFLQRVRDGAALTFADTLAVIDANYVYVPTTFRNGREVNASGCNEGSCKLFAFAWLNDLDVASTLSLFGEHYRHVLADPDGDGHPNIRAFMVSGWDGIEFDVFPLQPRHPSSTLR